MNFSWPKSERNDEAGGEKEERQSASEEPLSESTLATSESELGGAGGGPPPKNPTFSFAIDAAAVMAKANDIAVALNHTERTMAHVIAGIALRPDAAELFNKCHLSNGAIQPESGTVALSADQALRACLRYIEENVKSQSDERKADLPFSQDVRELLGRAEHIANDRSPDLRKIGVGDILEVIGGPDLWSRVKPVLLGSSSPSLSEISQHLHRIELAIAEVKNGAGMAGFAAGIANVINQMQAVLRGHMSKFNDVVSATEPSRTSLEMHSIVSETGLASPRADETIKLRNITSALVEIGGGSKKQEEELVQVNIRIEALEGLCLKMMAIAGVSALAALLLLGVVGYKSLI
jgi:hypothetical protein